MEVVEWATQGGTSLRLGFYAALGDDWVRFDPRCPHRCAASGSTG